MSDDGDVDVESSEDVPEIGGEATATTANSMLYGGHDRRAHHNALERRRRDHIKDSFSGLRDCIPSLVGEKVSRAHVLNKATEYIRHMQKSGSTREEDICELARKNEVLEEQVRGLEEARSRGVKVNPEEILTSIATRVQNRQSQEMITQQQHQAKVNSKSKSSSGGGGAIASSKNTTTITSTMSVPARPHTTQATGASTTSNNKMVTRESAAGKSSDVTTSTSLTSSATSTGTSQTAPVSPNMNLLASKLKNPQSFLAALQKAGNLQNIKNLAACVLASPLMKGAAATQAQAKATQASSPTIPRGIVTATTVPKGGGVSIPAVKPSASVHVTGNTVNIQQPTASPAPTPLAAAAAASSSSSVTLAALVEEALKKTDTGTNSSSSIAGAGGNTSATTMPQNPPANLITPVQAPPISPTPPLTTTVTNSPSLPDTSQLSSSLLEVHNLLQQQVRSPIPAAAPVVPRPPSVDEDVGVGQGLAGFSPELLAQVSSILNLPSLSGTGTGSPLTMGSQGAMPSSSGEVKRSSPSDGFDNPPASKRPHIDQ